MIHSLKSRVHHLSGRPCCEKDKPKPPKNFSSASPFFFLHFSPLWLKTNSYHAEARTHPKEEPHSRGRE
jgi:hypothetical protein